KMRARCGAGVASRFLGEAKRAPRRLAAHREVAGAAELDDAVGLDELEERLDLALVARQLDHEVLVADVDDLRAEQLADLDDVRAVLRRGLELGQDELAGDGLAGLEVVDLDDVDELVELLGDL